MSEKRFNTIVYIYFFIFLVTLIVSATRTQEILTSNALAEIRGEQYRGEAVSYYDHLSGIPRYICAVCYILSPSSLIMILFFFIGLTHFHKGLLFSIITMCSSLTMLLVAINIVDRSNFAYWGLTFVLCYILFRQHFSGRTKWLFYLLALFLAVIMIAYLVSVTISRFGEGDNGAAGGLVSYLGMSYINFCNFFNYLVFEVPHKPEIVLLPNINTYILHGPSYFEFAESLSREYHGNVSTFSTFIGLIMSVAGVWLTILYCLIYNIISRQFLRRPVINQISLKRLILFWVVVLNLILGLFGYYYMSAGIVMNIVIWWFIGVFVTARTKKDSIL